MECPSDKYYQEKLESCISLVQQLKRESYENENNKDAVKILTEYCQSMLENSKAMERLARKSEQTATIYCFLFYSLILIESIRYVMKGF